MKTEKPVFEEQTFILELFEFEKAFAQLIKQYKVSNGLMVFFFLRRLHTILHEELRE